MLRNRMRNRQKPCSNTVLHRCLWSNTFALDTFSPRP
ncbi:hypothetical protein X976_4702 [Burkholderia pseudomallei MSHR7500]|nr:hypothetical protein X976_4702 [Burkholderia pseudomallei MSHR7500]